eukprot:Blabericola_migrator_1__1557@NODE_140_length_13109_cov_183_610106_g122_i0_p11_GENE_NODE_140_length_13109_cov_183_610106_g122_i0NODE_140_length_13109_cov_183_610106_g122_i0_p11_ORF_typecomplete_len100_score9_12_NODE_140_length_13109_cov_183_610106_g122_i059906289
MMVSEYLEAQTAIRCSVAEQPILNLHPCLSGPDRTAAKPFSFTMQPLGACPSAKVCTVRLVFVLLIDPKHFKSKPLSLMFEHSGLNQFSAITPNHQICW